MAELATYFAKTNKGAIHIVDTQYAVLGRALCGSAVQHNDRPAPPRTALASATCKRCLGAAGVGATK